MTFQIVHAVLYCLAALVLLTWAGNVVCRQMFTWTGLHTTPPAHTGARPAGWLIGWLERLILAIGIVTHSWEVLAAVIALKTVARFKELDQQAFAEYFLVGSLFSLLWAVLITTGWLAYDHSLGIGLRAEMSTLLLP